MPKAIITGASSGIGEALARRLAREGYDLLLVARRKDRLEGLAHDLSLKHPVKADVLALDVTAPDAAARLLERAGDADVLVNNAGYGKHGPMIEIPPDQALGMVRLNCESLLALTQAFLPRMVARKSGTILNVGSIAGIQPLPFEAVYGATKAFVNSLSVALDEEVRRHGVRVLVICPGPVPTEFQEIANSPNEHAPGFVKVSAEQVADECAWMIRKGKRKRVPNAILRLAMWCERLAPEWFVVSMAGRVLAPKKVLAPEKGTPPS